MSVKQEAIDHYERMQEWVRTQPGNDRPSSAKMRKAIGEHWGSHYCSYCKKYDYDDGCDYCPLVNCCTGPLRSMIHSRTWDEWLENSDDVVEYIKKHG